MTITAIVAVVVVRAVAVPVAVELAVVLNSSLKKTDGLLEKYKSSIKDLYSLGKYIGDTIADSLNSINWDNVYQSASNFGKGLADFLNGLISPKLFTALGKTIAGSIRTCHNLCFFVYVNV